MSVVEGASLPRASEEKERFTGREIANRLALSKASGRAHRDFLGIGPRFSRVPSAGVEESERGVGKDKSSPTRCAEVPRVVQRRRVLSTLPGLSTLSGPVLLCDGERGFSSHLRPGRSVGPRSPLEWGAVPRLLRRQAEGWYRPLLSRPRGSAQVGRAWPCLAHSSLDRLPGGRT